MMPLERPGHWLPRDGEPSCILEWISQAIIKTLAFLPVYIALVVTLILLIELFHPLGLGILK